jgi:hypothetical protein
MNGSWILAPEGTWPSNVSGSTLSPTNRIARGVGGPLLLDGTGTVKLVLLGSKDTLTLENTSLATSMGVPNILSMSKLANAGICGEWDSNTITLRSKETGKLLATAVRRKNDLYYLGGVTHTPPQLTPAEFEKRIKEVDNGWIRWDKEKQMKMAAALRLFHPHANLGSIQPEVLWPVRQRYGAMPRN